MSEETTKPPARGERVGVAQDAMVLAGALLFAYGAWRAWAPAGFMVAGVFLLVPGVIGALRVRGSPPPKDGDS